MKPLQPIYRFAIGFLVALFIAAALIIWIDKPSNSTTQQDVTVQHVIDSLTTAHNAELIAREDSIQAVAYSNLALLQAEKDKLATRAAKAEKKLTELNKTVEELEIQYAEQCGELINGYRERNDTCMSIIKQKTALLTVCNAENNQYQSIINSQSTEIVALNKTVKTKNETIATQRDYITGVTNRADRSLLFRNWKWLWGNWSDYVLGK